MKKYLQVISISWQNGLVYQISVVLWRLRQFLLALMSLSLWTFLFVGQENIASYSRENMISYVIVVIALQSLLLSTSLHGLANDIYSGKISHLLLKPVNIFGYLFSQDIADKFKNFGFAIVELGILLIIFQPTITIPSLFNTILFILSLGLGLGLYFLILLLFGSFGFWSPETWAPRFLFFMFLDFTAGKLYPLDILPKAIQNLVYLTPFPYLSYFQSQLFLERLTIHQIVSGFLAGFVWLILILIINQRVWQAGFRNYSAAGQ